MSRMARSAGSVVALLVLLAGPLVWPSQLQAVDEYSMETTATYTADPAGVIEVEVAVDFTNTAPNPPGQFSVFEEVKLAVHDGVTEVSATDDSGALEVSVEEANDVNIATVELRDGVRFEESASFTLTYQLRDSRESGVHIHTSLVTFPAWGFGTGGTVLINLPAGYEVLVDGDTLTAAPSAAGIQLRSGQIGDPTAWLAVVTATRPPTYVTMNASVPLAGGTADLQVRAWDDDEAWGRRMLALLTDALPLFEEAIGLPYPRVSPLVVTEVAPVDPSQFGEGEPAGTEIRLIFDQPEFTALHQVAHVWLNETLAERRWLREGLASYVAAVAAAELGVDPPYDPATRAEELASDSFPLDAWAEDAAATGSGDDFGYAASWAFVTELAERTSHHALVKVLRRAAAGLDGYEPPRPDGRPGLDGETLALDSRGFLDHLETISGADLADRFAGAVFDEADAALLDERRTARHAYALLLTDAGDWGAPVAVRADMVSWRFSQAEPGIALARAWLRDAEALLAEIEAAGLSAPERLRVRYQEVGGGPEAQAELEAERAVVTAYAATLERVNAERSIIERIGIAAGPQPAVFLASANGLFAEGDLRGAADAVNEAQRLIDGAHTSGLVRIASALVLTIALLAVAVLLLRRRRPRAAHDG